MTYDRAIIPRAGLMAVLDKVDSWSTMEQWREPELRFELRAAEL